MTIGSSAQGIGRRWERRSTSQGARGAAKTSGVCKRTRATSARGTRDGNRGDAHVDAPFGQALERVGGVAGLQLDVDVGMALAELAEELREKRLAGGHRGEEDDGPGQRLAPSAEIALQPLPALQRLAGVSGEARPLRRQAHRAAIPLQQRPAGLALQALHRAREGRGADMAGAARAQEVQRARQMQEEPERVVIHRLSSIAEIATDSGGQISYRNCRLWRTPARHPFDECMAHGHGAVTNVTAPCVAAGAT